MPNPKNRTRPSMPDIFRMVELHSVGLSNAAVAAVLRLDTGKNISGDQVRYYVREYGCRERRPQRYELSKYADRPQQFRAVEA